MPKAMPFKDIRYAFFPSISPLNANMSFMTTINKHKRSHWLQLITMSSHQKVSSNHYLPQAVFVLQGHSYKYNRVLAMPPNEDNAESKTKAKKGTPAP